MMVKR